jgi:flavin-dependent dehydrogenase
MHHKVCGEFLSYEAANYARRLGLDLPALGALPIRGLRLARRKCIAECELPFPAMSITRRRLDEALLSRARDEGAIVQRDLRVERFEQTGSGWRAHLSNGETRHARSIFLATGKHDVTGHRRPPGTHNGLIAFKMYFGVTAEQRQALRGWIELVLFPGGYAGLQLTEDGDANLCLLVNRSTLIRCGNNWHRLFSHLLQSSEHLAARLEQAEPLLPKPLALSSIPYGMLYSHSEPGLWRLGDQAAVTPSFAGDGISIALHSAMLAADFYVCGKTSDQAALRSHRELRRPISLATSFSKLMIAAPGLTNALHAWPSLLGAIAKHTRVPHSALAV